jgi:hypothetical protein
VVEEFSGCKSDIELQEIMNRPETRYGDHHIAHLIKGYTSVGGKQVPVLSRNITAKDRVGEIKVRCGMGRYKYYFPTGLYLIGKVKAGLPVIVTSNYKLTLDKLRSRLKSEGYWLLVLDTKGINVWCAAGKGTFSTEELVYQLTKWQLKSTLDISSVIVPQLGASRMAPAIVKRLTGIRVDYGPIRAEDLDAYLANDRVANENMRQVQFNWKDRLVLTPLELIQNFKYILPAYPVFVLWHYFASGYTLNLTIPFLQFLPLIMMNLLGSVLFPLMLPFLPTRGFSSRGIILALPVSLLLLANSSLFYLGGGLLGMFSWLLIYLAYTGFVALNFTGSTTFTSLSGVSFEVKLFRKIGAAMIVISLVSAIAGYIL